MVTEITIPWPTEDIPNSDLLFMRVHKALITPDGNISASVFVNHGDPSNPDERAGMSTDWQKHSTPEECRARARDNRKDPNNYAVISLNVGAVRNIEGQTVEHTPIYKPPIENRAHTDVFGEKDVEARLQLKMIAEQVLRLLP